MIRIVALLFCLVLVSSSVWAKKLPCRNDLTPVDDPSIAYMQRANRCEGFYQSPVSGGFLSLVSLLYGQLEFDLKKDEELHIIVPRVGDQQVHIQAVGVPIDTYYRLDAWEQPGKQFTWPLDVIVSKPLRPEHIGFFGQPANEQNDNVYVPLIVEGNDFSVLNLVIRSSVDVSSVYWRSIKMDGRKCGQFEKNWKEIKPDWGDRFFSGDPILLSLYDQKDNCCIQISAQPVNSKGDSQPLLKIILKE